MKIAYIHPFLNLRGGAERKSILIVRGLLKDNSVDLIVSKFDPNTSFTELLQTIPPPIIISAPSKLTWILRTTSYCLKNKYDRIVASNPPANVVACLVKALRPRTKIIWICNEVAPTLHESKPSALKRVTWIIEKALATLFDLVIANSSFTAQSILEYFNQKSEVIRSGVDVSLEKNEVPPSSLAYLEGSKFFLTVSRIEKHKNIDFAVKIARAYPDVNFIVAGAGVDSPYFETIVRNIPQIKYLGSISDAEKSWLMNNANVFLFLPTHEPLGVTVMEAIAKNIPVVAFNSGGPKEVVLNGKNGLLCDNEDDYLKNIEVATSLLPVSKENGFDYIQEKFSNERMVSDFRNAILR